jgi:hypothetical protein
MLRMIRIRAIRLGTILDGMCLDDKNICLKEELEKERVSWNSFKYKGKPSLPMSLKKTISDWNQQREIKGILGRMESILESVEPTKHDREFWFYMGLQGMEDGLMFDFYSRDYGFAMRNLSDELALGQQALETLRERGFDQEKIQRYETMLSAYAAHLESFPHAIQYLGSRLECLGPIERSHLKLGKLQLGMQKQYDDLTRDN